MTNQIQKSYNSIKELPSEVRSSFDEKDQEKWMTVYNKMAGDSKKDEVLENARINAWKSMVDAPSSLAVETWASVEVRDADGELIPIDTIVENSDKFIQSGGLMHDSHTNVPIGTAWAWEERWNAEANQPGIVYWFNVYRDSEVFDQARDDILSGRKNSVSIGAEAPRGGYKCDDRGCYVERDVTDLYEISICETPANPMAGFIAIGKDIAKKRREGTIMRFNVSSFDIHQDYTTCPLQKCKNDVRTAVQNADVHIIEDTVVATCERESDLLNALKKMNAKFRYNLIDKQFEIMPYYNIDNVIDEALSNEWACDDGVGHYMLTRDIPEEVFKSWYDDNMIQLVGDVWCIRADDVVKDGGSMGVGTAGAVNSIYSVTDEEKSKSKSRYIADATLREFIKE